MKPTNAPFLRYEQPLEDKAAIIRDLSALLNYNRKDPLLKVNFRNIMVTPSNGMSDLDSSHALKNQPLQVMTLR